MSQPTNSEMAAYVLRVGEPTAPDGHPYPEPGAFYAALVDAFMKADMVNRARLSVGFAILGQMVTTYKDVPGGVEVLRMTFETGVW